MAVAVWDGGAGQSLWPMVRSILSCPSPQAIKRKCKLDETRILHKPMTLLPTGILILDAVDGFLEQCAQDRNLEIDFTGILQTMTVVNERQKGKGTGRLSVPDCMMYSKGKPSVFLPDHSFWRTLYCGFARINQNASDLFRTRNYQGFADTKEMIEGHSPP